jgi:hypothetical protein
MFLYFAQKHILLTINYGNVELNLHREFLGVDRMVKKIEKHIRTTQVFYKILALIGIFPGIMMGMVFDAPGSEKELFRWLLFLSFPCFVLTVIFAALFLKKYIQEGQYKKAVLLNLIPALWIIVGISEFIYWFLQGES